MELENVVARLAEQVERRFFGKYRGFVVDNADPEQLGRLTLTVPSVLGADVVTGWAMPCVPYGGRADQGFLFIPEVGAGVWVEFEEGDLEFPIWVGTFWSKPAGESEMPKPNDAVDAESAPQDPPTRKILKTAKGHTLQFEDAEGQEKVVLVEAEHGHVVTLDQDGIRITHGRNQHEIRMTDQGVTISGEKKVCLEGLIKWLMNHTHVGNLGAPCPLHPAQMAELAPLGAKAGEILSQNVKLG